MLKAIFFDLTDTLQHFDWNKQWQLLVPYVNKTLKTNIATDEFKKKYQQVYESYRLGWINDDKEFFDLLCRQLSINATKRQVIAIAKKNLSIRKRFTWLPRDYDKTLKELRKRYKLAVVSSGVATWCYHDYKRIFGFDFKKHFDLVLFSQEQGYLKDSGKLFEVALKKLRLKPGEAVFVGNDYEEDILLAKRHGLGTAYLNKEGTKGKADYLIRELRELSKIL